MKVKSVIAAAVVCAVVLSSCGRAAVVEEQPETSAAVVEEEPSEPEITIELPEESESEPEEEPIEEDDGVWREKYIEYLESHPEYGELVSFDGSDVWKMGLTDLNYDGRQELVLDGTSEADGMVIAAIFGDEVKDIQIFRHGLSVNRDYGVIANDSGNMGEFFTYVYRMTDTGFEELGTGKYKYSETGEMEIVYTEWNGQEVSVEEYEAIIKSNCGGDISDMEDIGYENDFNDSYEGMLFKLKNGIGIEKKWERNEDTAAVYEFLNPLLYSIFYEATHYGDELNPLTDIEIMKLVGYSFAPDYDYEGIPIEAFDELCVDYFGKTLDINAVNEEYIAMPYGRSIYNDGKVDIFLGDWGMSYPRVTYDRVGRTDDGGYEVGLVLYTYFVIDESTTLQGMATVKLMPSDESKFGMCIYSIDVNAIDD